MGSYSSVYGAWWSFLKEKPARSGFENGFVQSLPSQCVGAGPRWHSAARRSAQWQGRGGGAAAGGQCTGACAKQERPGPQFGRDLFGSFLARDRLSGDRNSQIFPAEKSFVKTGVHIFGVKKWILRFKVIQITWSHICWYFFHLFPNRMR